MNDHLRIASLVAAGAIACSTLASAQALNGGGQVGPSGVIMSPVAPQPSPPAATTSGLGGGVSQPGAPNSTTPGRIGTGATPSGLAGDSPSAPGFPGKVGR